VKFNNERLSEFPVDTPDGYPQEAENLASASARFILQYLLGVRTDFGEVREYVRKGAADAVCAIENYPSVEE
jgi:hypothetical protein